MIRGNRVSPELRERVFLRDGYRCVAPSLGADDVCRDRWDEPLSTLLGHHVAALTIDHVKDEPAVGDPIVKRGPELRGSRKAPSDERHLVTLCWHHHLNGWATANRGTLRDYLRRSDGS